MNRRALLIGLLSCSALACSDSSGPNTEIVITGTYTLRTINGQTLPVVVLQNATTRQEAMSSALTLNNNSTFTEVSQYRITTGAVSTNNTASSTGIYSRTNNSITFTQNIPTSSVFIGAYGDNAITVTNGTNTLVYRR